MRPVTCRATGVGCKFTYVTVADAVIGKYSIAFNNTIFSV
jgi:hypothetical protein